MTQTIKDFAPILLEEIKKAKSVLLHCHPSPDPDSIGSALAMKLAVEQLGKRVTLIKGDSEIPSDFVFPGIDTITPKTYGELDLSEYDLFIILDSSSKDRISSISDPVFPESMQTIVIDHHKSNELYAKINCVDSSYPATAQMLYDLFNEMGVELDHDIALNLFMGIYTDTGGFRYRSVQPSTLEAASILAKYAPDFPETIFIMENNNTKEGLLFEGLALSSVKDYFGGKMALSVVSFADLEKNNIKDEDTSTAMISNKLKSVVGTEIAATMIESEPQHVKISFRTRDQEKYDVSKIAVALGGGGHKSAAGARLIMPLNEAIEKVVKTTKEIYNL